MAVPVIPAQPVVLRKASIFKRLPLIRIFLHEGKATGTSIFCIES
jgi:hypothetical protein